MLKTIQKLNNSIQEVKSKVVAYFSAFLPKIKNNWENAKKSFNPGLIGREQAINLALVCLIIFFGYVVLFKQHYNRLFLVQGDSLREKSPQEIEKEKLAMNLRALVKGHPIEVMIPYIVERDRKTAAYLIGIAKKESNWGERHPVLAGVDCYNYWGFRLQSERMGSGGHTCFSNPREAVNAVSDRIAQIIQRNDVNSAKDMLVWKCGTDCSATGGQVAANKWARDVDKYAKKVLN